MNEASARSYLESTIRGMMDYAHILAGVKTGIFDALGRAGGEGTTPADLAATLGYREDYVRIWCETSFALGLLDAAGPGRFRVADGFDTLLVSGPPPASVAGMFTFHGLFASERLELAAILQSGEERPRSDSTFSREQAAGLVGGSRAQAQVRTESIYLRFPEVTDRLRAGGRMLDVGCGTGTQIESLARTFPSASFAGIEPLRPMLEVAGEILGADGLGDRVSLRQIYAEQLESIDEFDVVTMNIVLHEMAPATRPAAVAAMYRALRPGGVLISNDFLYPNRREDFRRPEFALGVFDQAMEMSWGSRHLSRDQIRDLFRASGFRRCEFHEIPLPFPALVRPGSGVSYLAALAFK